MHGFLKYQTIASRSFEGEDLSAPLAFQLLGCTLTACNFDRAVIKTNLGRRFEDCTFRGTHLSGSVLRGEFLRCDFSKANLSRTMASEVTFEDCIFHGTNFTKVTYHWIKFFRCRFEGCKFRQGEIGNSKFIDCTWTGNEVSDVFCEKTEMPDSELPPPGGAEPPA